MLLARYMNWNRPCSTLWRRLRLQEVKMRNDALGKNLYSGEERPRLAVWLFSLLAALLAFALIFLQADYELSFDKCQS